MEAILNLPGLAKGSSLPYGRAKSGRRPWKGMEAILNLPELMKGSSPSSSRAKAGEERALAGDGSNIHRGR
jgi:hypothetical protein